MTPPSSENGLSSTAHNDSNGASTAFFEEDNPDDTGFMPGCYFNLGRDELDHGATPEEMRAVIVNHASPSTYNELMFQFYFPILARHCVSGKAAQALWQFCVDHNDLVGQLKRERQVFTVETAQKRLRREVLPHVRLRVGHWNKNLPEGQRLHIEEVTDVYHVSKYKAPEWRKCYELSSVTVSGTYN